jgi:hypothetical protein
MESVSGMAEGIDAGIVAFQEVPQHSIGTIPFDSEGFTPITLYSTSWPTCSATSTKEWLDECFSPRSSAVDVATLGYLAILLVGP